MARSPPRSPPGVRLDAVNLSRADPEGMLGWVESSPRQWDQAVELARRSALPEVDTSRLRLVLVAGMGGSGIAGDVATVAARYHGRLPMIPVKGPDPGRLVGPETLLVAISHSGNTRETLAATEAALAADAAVVGVTSGGQLARRLGETDATVVTVPGEGQPRANLAHLAATTLVVLERLGLLTGTMRQLEGVGDHLRALAAAWHHARPARANLIKRMAGDLDGLCPVFYGARGWPAVAALRGKCQVNENAKRPAFCGELTEIDHNEVVGWRALPEVARRLAVVELHSPVDEPPEVAAAFAATRDAVGGRAGAYLTAETFGPTPLARLAGLLLFVDLLSVYLAFLEGQDPTPVTAIDTLKQRLAVSGP